MRVVKSFLISLAVLIALPIFLFGFVRLNDQKQTTAHYFDREILRTVYESAAWTNSDNTDVPALRRKAFFEKIPEGSDRTEVVRKFAAERIGCTKPDEKIRPVKVECITPGHTFDFRWNFVLYFGDDNKLLDARIDTLKGG